MSSALSSLGFSFITFKMGMIIFMVKYLPNAYYMPDISFELLIWIRQLILTAALKDRHHFNPHFADEENEAEKNNFPNVIELVHSEAENPGNLGPIPGTEHQYLQLCILMLCGYFEYQMT